MPPCLQDVYNACEHASFGGGGSVNGQESDSARLYCYRAWFLLLIDRVLRYSGKMQQTQEQGLMGHCRLLRLGHTRF